MYGHHPETHNYRPACARTGLAAPRRPSLAIQKSHRLGVGARTTGWGVRWTKPLTPTSIKTVAAGNRDTLKKPQRFRSAPRPGGYYKHLDHPSRWRLRKAIEQALAAAVGLDTPRLEGFGRCAVLRTAQWALDGRNELPTWINLIARGYPHPTSRSAPGLQW
jgi:hypothetical protein